jgi:hypothetical protein
VAATGGPAAIIPTRLANFQFTAFTPSALEPICPHVNLMLLRWARRKFKRFAVRPTQAGRFLEQLARKPDAVFVHWRLATNGWFA